MIRRGIITMAVPSKARDDLFYLRGRSYPENGLSPMPRRLLKCAFRLLQQTFDSRVDAHKEADEYHVI